MIRRTKIGFARDEALPEVEEHLLDCDLVVFGRGTSTGRGRWSSATALRCSGPEGGAPALLSLRGDGLALVAGLDDEETLRLALSLPDPVVVVAVLAETGIVEAGLRDDGRPWRFAVINLDRGAAKLDLAPVGQRADVRATSWVWDHPVPGDEARSLAPRRRARRAGAEPDGEANAPTTAPTGTDDGHLPSSPPEIVLALGSDEGGDAPAAGADGEQVS